MDDIAGILKREIVLDCLEGTTLAQLWSYVEKAHREVVAMRGLDSGPIVVDEALKNYLWPYILQLKDILFVEGETIIYNAADLGASADPEFSQQSAAQVEEKYPELHVRGTLAAINKELFGREEGSKKIMSSPMASKIIQLLARSRGEGVTQAQLSKDLSIDPRSMYHFVKLLDFEGLVVKLAAFRKGCSTNLIVLRRFANEIPEPSISSTKEDNSGNAQGGSEPGSSITKKSMPDGEYSLTNTLVRIGVRSKITDILGKREHGLMVEYDVMDEISLDYWDVSQRKYFFRVVRDMVEAGYIKRVRAQVKDLHSSLDGEPSIDDDAVVLDGSDAEIEADAADSNADADADVQMDLEATDTDGKPESKGKDDDVIDNKRKRALTEKERREKRKVVERRRQGLRDGYNFKRCLQLVKPYKTKTRIHKKLGIPNQSINNDGMMMMDENGASINEGEDEDEDEEDNDKDEDDFTDEEELSIEDLKEREDLRLLFSNDILSAGLGASLGIDMQVFRLIALTGTYGTVARAIQHTLGEPNFKLIARMLTRLEAMHVYDANNMIPGVFFDPAAQNVSGFMISSVDEFVGRERRKRYFANPKAHILMASLFGSGQAEAPAPAPAPALSAALPVSTSNIKELDQGQKEQEAVHAAGLADVNTPASPRVDTMADSVRLQEESELGASSTTATAVVPASYASELNFEEIVREARESRASVNKIIREHIILQMLKREHVLNCSQDSAQRCSDEIKAYVLAHGKQLGMSQSTIEAIMRFKLDKKTLQASLTSLAGRGLLWLQVRPMSSISTCPNVPKNLRLAIARDVDPHGPTVQAYLLSLQEPRALRTMMSISKLPTLEANIEVQRSEGAQKIDDEIRGAVKQYELERSLMKRSQYRFTMAHRTPMDDNDHWFYIVQRLEARPRDICRIMDLHEWLVAQLPNAVDNKSVFPMYTFRPTFLFSHISLELILRMGGGISRHQGLRHFVRFGYDGKYPDSTEDEAMDDVERFPSSSREEMEARLAMPIHKLPAGVSQRFIERSSRTRVYFQRLLHELCLLRVLRPVAEIANIGDMPAPLDAQDASIMPDHPRIMAFAYQLIGVGRLVSRETVVNLADQPRFHGDQTFALLEPEGIAAFWEATMRLHTASKTLLPQSHLFHGIDRRMCWRRVLALTVRQSNVLLQYTNEETLMTPLGNAEMLETAAMAAQVPVSLARKFYKNIQITYDMRATKRDNQRKAYMKSMIERARAKAAEAEERRARGEMPEPAPKRVRLKHRRQPWTRAESCMVAMAFAVLINHARMHGHPFRVVAVSDLFLTYSASRNPNERVRKHWARIRQNPEMCALADALTILWRYVLDDALAEDALEDPPSLEDVDLKKAVYYFRDLLRTTSVESLIDRYAGQIAADEPAGWEDLLMGRHKMAPMDTGDVPVPAPVPVPEKQRSKDVALRYALASGALSRGQYQNVNTRLPATMKGCDDRYTVLTLTPDSRLRGLSRPAALLVLQEDLYYVNMTARNRQNNTYTTMLTAHMGASNMGDAARPVATDLKLPGEPESMVVAPAAEQLQGTDTMAPFWPIARTVDADALASGLQRLMLGDAEKVDGQMDVDAPAGTIAGDSEATEDAVSSARPVTSTPLGSQSSSAEQYAEVAAMQAMLVNLTLTPETQYNVTVGHDLLKAKGDASSEALESLTRHSSVVLLHSMESAVGLKDSNNSRSAADGPAGPVTAASTVVVHETQGTTRVATKEAPDNADVDAEIEMGLAAEGIEMEKQKASGSAVRQVPGRGMAISDKFLGAIAPTLPSNMFENDLTDAVSEGSLVDYHMQPSELVQLCDDVARCRLWLRPVYSKKLTNRRDNHYLTEAIRGAQAAGIMFFRPKVHYYRSAADAEPMDRWVDLEHSSRERGLRIVALSEESLEIASRLLCGCADLMGALGCSAYELCQLFERIDQSAFGGIRGDLLEELSEFMCAEPRVSALLRLLAADLVPGVPVCVRGQLVAVGSGDVRYVSRRVFDLHWSVRTKSAKQVYGDVQYLPVFGQSLSGRVLTQYTGQMMLSVLGWVFNNPGISLASLMRRYYSPMIPRFEVARYLGVLVDLGVLQGNWVEENRSTEYFLGERYYESAKRIAQCSGSELLLHL